MGYPLFYVESYKGCVDRTLHTVDEYHSVYTYHEEGLGYDPGTEYPGFEPTDGGYVEVHFHALDTQPHTFKVTWTITGTPATGNSPVKYAEVNDWIGSVEHLTWYEHGGVWYDHLQFPPYQDVWEYTFTTTYTGTLNLLSGIDWGTYWRYGGDWIFDIKIESLPDDTPVLNQVLMMIENN